MHAWTWIFISSSLLKLTNSFNWLTVCVVTRNSVRARFVTTNSYMQSLTTNDIPMAMAIFTVFMMTKGQKPEMQMTRKEWYENTWKLDKLFCIYSKHKIFLAQFCPKYFRRQWARINLPVMKCKPSPNTNSWTR